MHNVNKHIIFTSIRNTKTVFALHFPDLNATRIEEVVYKKGFEKNPLKFFIEVRFGGNVPSIRLNENTDKVKKDLWICTFGLMCIM